MDQIIPSKTVYCYYFPEVRKIISEASHPYPHAIYLQSMDPGLDDFHEPVLDAYENHMTNQLQGLGKFPYRYTTAGASEGIFHVLSHIASFNKEVPLYAWEGEYEGYSGYGTNLGLQFTSVPYETDTSELPKGTWFISNPSARDGMIIPNDTIQAIADAGHRIILDVTYVGSTQPHEFLVNHPAIDTVFISLSKPFGLYYYRIGFCYSKTEYKTLMVNKWFKNIFNHIIAKKILEAFSASELNDRYRSYQERAVREIAQLYEIPVVSSDVLLLAKADTANIPDSSRDNLQTYLRGEGYRFCLTPYFLKYEKENT
jgi:histidinol-phosphate/aromatic aminotransferase/cobyric acid decarboxylase-like protein